MVLSLLLRVVFLDCFDKNQPFSFHSASKPLFFRRQLCAFRSWEQHFTLESSYFATCLEGLYWRDTVVSSWHSCRQSSRGPSATPGNLRMQQGAVTSPLQASNCTEQPWEWTVWRTLVQFRERSLFIFCRSDVIWMYLKRCALLCYLCLKSFPPSSFLPFISKQPRLAQFQSPETVLSKSLSDSKSPSCKDPTCWLIQLRGNCTGHLGVFRWKACLSLLHYQTVWEHWKSTTVVTPDVYNRCLVNLMSAFHGGDGWPIGCLHVGTGYVQFSRQ